MKKAPFTFGTIASGEDFTDRIEESRRLLANFHNGVNTVLISPRRWGKSSLVRYAAQQTMLDRKDLFFCFIDLFNVRTEADFYHTLSQEVIKCRSSKWQNTLTETGKFSRGMMPVFNVSPDSYIDLSICPGGILNLAESICQDRHIQLVICIDEFQNISFYDDPLGFQKTLRSYWQHHTHVSYCLYGSKPHMLMEFFASSSMPFYKFGDLFFLQKISADYWIPFIQKRFADTGKHIDTALSQKIASTMANHPYYVQQLAQEIWLNSRENCTEGDFDGALDKLLRQHDFLFQREIDQLTTAQLNFLHALIDGVTQLTAKNTISKYRLGSSANIRRIRGALENKEIIDTAKATPVFQDPLFRYWLQNTYFR